VSVTPCQRYVIESPCFSSVKNANSSLVLSLLRASIQSTTTTEDALSLNQHTVRICNISMTMHYNISSHLIILLPLLPLSALKDDDKSVMIYSTHGNPSYACIHLPNLIKCYTFIPPSSHAKMLLLHVDCALHYCHTESSHIYLHINDTYLSLHPFLVNRAERLTTQSNHHHCPSIHSFIHSFT
jgi:hypothetical protein